MENIISEAERKFEELKLSERILYRSFPTLSKDYLLNINDDMIEIKFKTTGEIHYTITKKSWVLFYLLLNDTTKITYVTINFLKEIYKKNGFGVQILPILEQYNEDATDDLIHYFAYISPIKFQMLDIDTIGNMNEVIEECRNRIEVGRPWIKGGYSPHRSCRRRGRSRRHRGRGRSRRFRRRY